MTLWSMFLCFIILFGWLMLFGFLCWGLMLLKQGWYDLSLCWLNKNYEDALPGTMLFVFGIFMGIAIAGTLIFIPTVCWQHWDYLRQVTP